jgi:hypothetical protein
MVKDDLLERYRKYNPSLDYNGEIGMELANQLIARYGSIENIPKLIEKGKEVKEDRFPKKENQLEKGLIFVERADGMGINSDNLFADRYVKEKLIREYKGDKKYYSSFSDHRICVTFKNLYSNLKKLKK